MKNRYPEINIHSPCSRVGLKLGRSGVVSVRPRLRLSLNRLRPGIYYTYISYLSGYVLHLTLGDLRVSLFDCMVIAVEIPLLGMLATLFS